MWRMARPCRPMIAARGPSQRRGRSGFAGGSWRESSHKEGSRPVRRERLSRVPPELFHRTAPAGWEGNYNDFASVMPHMRAMTIPGLEADLGAAFHWLTEAAGGAPVHAV